MAQLIPTSQQLMAAAVSGASGYGVSFLLNRFAPSLSSIPGGAFVSDIESKGPLEAIMGLGIVQILGNMLIQLVGIF